MSRVTQVETFARAGFTARGIVYILLGYFALSTAGSEGTTGVLEAIKEAPLGAILLALVGIGLLAYGLFRLYGAAVDLQGSGTGAKGAATRIGHAASGLAHLFLGYYALSRAFGADGGSGGGEGEAAATLASVPGGTILLAAIGIGFLLAAANQLQKAWTAHFMALLDADAPAAARTIGRLGYAARAVVFAVLGWRILAAVLAGNPERVGGIGAVLASLRDTGWLYTVVAIGLILFGIYSLVMARYRRIRNEDVLARLQA